MSFSQVNFEIVRRNDRDLIKAFQKIAEEVGQSSGTMAFGFSGGIPQHNVPISELENDALLASIFIEESFVVQSIRIELPNSVQLSVSRSNQVLDQATIQPGGERDRDRYLQLIAKARKHLSAFESGASVAAILGEQGKQFEAVREATLARLESIATSLVDDTRKYRTSLDQEYSERLRTQEAQLQARLEQLDNEHKRRMEELGLQEKTLIDRAKSLDDRESRHVRRELYKNQKQKFSEVSSKFELTKGTRGLRIPIHIFSIALLSALVVLETVLVNQMSNTPPTGQGDWVFSVARQLLIGLGFCATAVFYLRWCNRWFEQHAHEEFRLKRLEIDVDRASWLVETAMEWKDMKGDDIPESLVDRLAKNLFDDPQKNEIPLHPVDQLASQLLGASAQVHLPIGKGAISIDRKGIKELKKAGNE